MIDSILRSIVLTNQHYNRRILCPSINGTLDLNRIIPLESGFAYLFIPGSSWQVRFNRIKLNRRMSNFTLSLDVDFRDKQYVIVPEILVLQSSDLYALTEVIKTIATNNTTEINSLLYSHIKKLPKRQDSLIIVNLSLLVNQLAIKRELTYQEMNVTLTRDCGKWRCAVISLVSTKVHYYLVKSNYFGATPSQRALRLEQLTT